MTTISTQSIRFTGTLGKAVNPGRFLSRIPDSATVRVTRDAGGGTPSDPGGTVRITAEWTDDEEGQ